MIYPLSRLKLYIENHLIFSLYCQINLYDSGLHGTKLFTANKIAMVSSSLAPKTCSLIVCIFLSSDTFDLFHKQIIMVGC